MFCYCDLIDFLNTLETKGLKAFSIGKTCCGRDIFCVKVGDENKPHVLIQYAIHARECFCGELAKLHIELARKNPPKNCCIFFIPLANPDGAELVVHGINTIENKEFREKISSINSNIIDWKSNIRGVDLNNNFDAEFQRAGTINYFSSHGFKGQKPFSEPEAFALSEFTIKNNIEFSLSFHAKGEEIYYNFFQHKKLLKRDKKIAKLFAENFRYKIKNVEKFSSGGYKDWCIQKLYIPSLTIEVGQSKKDYTELFDDIQNIFETTKEIVNLCDKSIEIKRIYDKRRKIHA